MTVVRGDTDDPGGYHLAIDFMTGLYIRGNGGLLRVQRLVVVQQGGSLDGGVGIVVLGGEAQLL